MPSRNALLAEAVKTALNGTAAQAAFTLPFTAKRLAVPVADLDAFKTLTVSVIAAGDDTTQWQRDDTLHELVVFVGIEKKIAGDPSKESANAEIDQLMLLVEQICDFDYGDQTDGVPSALGLFDSSTVRVLSDPPSMLTQKLFRGVVAVSFIVPV